MPIIPQQGREARGGIEAREAQPVHRAGASNKSGGLQIADQAIVLEEHQLAQVRATLSSSPNTRMPQTTHTHRKKIPSDHHG